MLTEEITPVHLIPNFTVAHVPNFAACTDNIDIKAAVKDTRLV